MALGVPVDVAQRLVGRTLLKAARSSDGRGESLPQEAWTEELARKYNSVPVDELLDDPQFFGAVGGKDLWPEVRKDIIELWRERKENNVSVFLDEEGIGSGKTTKMAAICALMMYQALTDWDFRKRFGLMKQSRVAFITGSRGKVQSQEVTFDSFLPFCGSPFLRKYFPSNYRQEDFDPAVGGTRRVPKAIRFPGNFFVFPLSSEALSLLGYSIYVFSLDEANYLDMVVGSRRAIDGPVYDAAQNLFEEALARCESRFKVNGVNHGLIMMVSNRRHSKGFLSRMINLVQRGRRDEIEYLPPTMVRSRNSWDARPAQLMSKEYFVFDTQTMTSCGEGVFGDSKFPNVPERRG